ncbi:NUDIX domain-containing protein [Isoptericola cucumis]|uniref:NUDIX hydrolase n=1 Tax=Isoptericola cucumis TaxID=1776856 RepID=A0ABQ2B3Z2_9MICO|nr:NUDIX domain-containing protein [Isoptericola cucumis]GGI05205.1 NUDIX hydrolase [Isoptericola cucumis]
MRWVVSVKGVLIVRGAVLLCLNDRGEWELPGGQLEDGERPRETVVRELAEETALHVRAGRLLLADTFEVVPGRTVLIVAYECASDGDLAVTVSEEHQALRWTPLDELDAIALPEIYRRAVRAV